MSNYWSQWTTRDLWFTQLTAWTHRNKFFNCASWNSMIHALQLNTITVINVRNFRTIVQSYVTLLNVFL